jgi:hypothetical protein
MTDGAPVHPSTPKAPVVGELTKPDAALALVTIIASALPIVGGPAASAASEIRRTFDRRQASRLAATVDELRASLDTLADHVDRDLGSDPAFAAFVEAALESASQARHAEKRRYYVALMARSATRLGPEDVQRAILLDTLDRVQATHLRLLYAVFRGPAPDHNADYAKKGTPAFEAIHDALPGIDEVILHRAWEDMVSLGLLESWTDYLVTEESPPKSEGALPLTPFASYFLEFIAPV